VNRISPQRRPQPDTQAAHHPSIIDPAAASVALPSGPPMLQIVVDTEEEFDWQRPFDRNSVAVTAMQAQHLVQELVAPYGLKPTYVVDYPVATTPESVAVFAALLAANQCQIGAHLHPWVNPPHEEAVSTHNSYPGNLPAALERAKLTALTDAITAAFGARPLVYKAGRYGVGPSTTALLEELGYLVDLSVVPLTDFGGDGGPDFTACPDRPYWVGEPGTLLEIPLTRGFSGRLAGSGPGIYRLAGSAWGARARAKGILARLGLLERATLTPEGVDFAAHARLVDAMLRQGHRVFSLSYHSPSLVPGFTPYVRSPGDLVAFLDCIKRILELFFERLDAVPTTALEIRRYVLESASVAAPR
jgi:hypothetical protein